ncbi:thiolase family protein [Flavobacterium macacae]|uniref:Acetyl-CoA C-acyltransferase n=1 Tax=Flavobacterium macacae TaxID=2488993 RepID=A0A3P3WE32_9FLAO|nr:acetyl-CoA C-acyltransferase [Flavobacterium macacae]RRJ90813.1 acetyl-CoA C-acyltransferase [Flavobacterium macacae]
MMGKINKEIWLVSGLRTPFVKENRELKDISAIALSVSVVNNMRHKEPIKPDYLGWGTVVPNLAYSNIARDIVLESELADQTVAFSTTMACASSVLSTIQLASMITDDETAISGGVESFSNVQLGLSNETSKWVKGGRQLHGIMAKLKWAWEIFKFKLYIPPGVNRITGKSMGQHAEITAQRLGISRNAQDALALVSHKNYFKAKNEGFFSDLIFPAFTVAEDLIPRKDTTMEKLSALSPVFDRTSGKGSITAGNSSLFTDGAAGVWVAGKNRIDEFHSPYRARLTDWETAAVNIEEEGILMSPTFAIARLLERNKLTYNEIDIWEIHEAFAAQVLSTISILESPSHLDRMGVKSKLGNFPMEKLNIKGSSISIGHPFGATGARIISQTLKQLHLAGANKKALISVCADGGLGAVILLEN